MQGRSTTVHAVMLAAGMALAACEPDGVEEGAMAQSARCLDAITVVDSDGMQTRFDIGRHAGRMDDISVWMKDPADGETWLLYDAVPSYNSQHLLESLWVYSYEDCQSVTVGCHHTDGRLDRMDVPRVGAIAIGYDSHGRVDSLTSGSERFRLDREGWRLTVAGRETARVYLRYNDGGGADTPEWKNGMLLQNQHVKL